MQLVHQRANFCGKCDRAKHVEQSEDKQPQRI